MDDCQLHSVTFVVNGSRLIRFSGNPAHVPWLSGPINLRATAQRFKLLSLTKQTATISNACTARVGQTFDW